MFFGFVFEETGESVELPSVEFLVPRLPPLPRVTVLILADVTEVANRDLLHAFVDTPLNDVLGECVEEVVFTPGEFLPSRPRSLGRPVLAFGLVLLAGEIVLVLFQHVPRIQFRRAVLVVDGEVVADSEVDTRRLVAGSILNGNLFLADEVQLPVVSVPDGTHLLDVLDFYVGPSFVLRKDEVRPPVLQIPTFRKAELTVFGVVLDTFLFPRHGGSWVSVATFPVARWVVAVVGVIPPVERLSKLFENSLT